MRQSLAVAREPLAAAEMIPLAAAERDALFFYGTLSDIDVLAYVLARPIDLAALEPGTLDGFRRVEVLGASYPLLVADAGARVEGLLLRRATRRDIVRINHFESGEYRAELHPVRTADGALRHAWLYAGLDTLPAGGAAWELRTWQRRHKAGFFAACDGWMADCPDIE